MSSASNRKLQIQISVCKRMLKEVESYKKEVITNEARVQKMRDEEKDIYDIRKQEEVLQESYMMIPDSQRRCDESIQKLISVMAELEGEELNEDLYNEANKIISDNQS